MILPFPQQWKAKWHLGATWTPSNPCIITDAMTEESKPKTVELVRTDYQLTKAEKEEILRVNASMEEIADAMLSPVNIRWIDRPRDRRRRK